VRRITGRENIHVWMGECHVHAGIDPEHINLQRAAHPGAEFLIHPECGCTTSILEYQSAGDIGSDDLYTLSTGGMLDHARAMAPGTQAIVATETGMLHPLRQANPDVDFVAANEMAVCRYMKKITLPKLRDTLRDLAPEVRVPADVAERARIPIERMVAIG
jgi:quinolinate synthase